MCIQFSTNVAYFSLCYCVSEPSRTATLMESDLKDGLKILSLQEGRFWPSRLNSTALPGIFGVVVEGQRGSRPNILTMDEILNQAVSTFYFQENKY